ncbi:hypothetical protein ACFWHW_36575 [Streptomyces pharetrae]|uniref:hypothetical protein n=1 Tax=Streptomyces pharetrae TaxID=291370 RepID=UPI00364FB534
MSALLGIGRGRDRPVRPADTSPFSAGRGGVLVGSDDGGVDLDQPVTGGVGSGLDLLQGPGEHALDRVATEAGIDRYAGKAFRAAVAAIPPTHSTAHRATHVQRLIHNGFGIQASYERRSGLSPKRSIRPRDMHVTKVWRASVLKGVDQPRTSQGPAGHGGRSIKGGRR